MALCWMRRRLWRTLGTAFVVALPELASAAWRTEAIEAVGSVSRGSLRWHEASANLAIAFGGSALRFAQHDGLTWSIEEADAAGCVEWASLAFDAADEPLIAWQDGFRSTLMLSRRVAGGWSAESVDPVAGRGAWASLALAPDGTPAIAYEDGSARRLLFARLEAGTWRIEVIDDSAAAGGGASLAYDRAGMPAVSYVCAAGLRLARRGATGWDIEDVDARGIAVAGTALAFDAAGHPAIAYGGGDDSVRYAGSDGATWSLETAAAPGWAGGERWLQFDRSGAPRIAYTVLMSESRVRVARKVAGSWSMVEVARPAAGQVSLALDGDDRSAVSASALVSVQTPNAIDIEVLHEGTGGWVVDRLADNQTYSGRPGAAFAPDGEPAAAWIDATWGRIRYGHRQAGSWQLETVAVAGHHPAASPLAFDGSGVANVAWLAADGKVHVARRLGASWVEGVVDDIGGTPAIARSPTGAVTLAWRSPGVQEIHLARWDGARWSAEVVWAGRANGAAVAHAYRGDGRPGVAFHDLEVASLRLAEWDGSQWATREVTAVGSGVAVPLLSLAYDPAGQPALAWVQPGVPELRLSRFDGVSWSTEVAVLGAVSSAALAFGPAGEPRLAWTSSALDRPGPRFSTRAATGWYEEALDPDCRGGGLGLAADASGAPSLAYTGSCRGEMRWVQTLPVVLLRGVVASVGPGWKPAALPLDSSRDAATPPFPISGDTGVDAISSSAPLVLYRALGPADEPRGNRLRAARNATGVALQFVP